jgi:uncharacterized protein YndB with AHSA1/START domain
MRTIQAIKRRAEEEQMAERPTFVYVTYIESSAERVWEALTEPEITSAYWGASNVSDWRVGSPWEHRRADGSDALMLEGKVVESVPPRRLALTWAAAGEAAPDKISKVSFDIEPYHEIVRLTVVHEDLDDESFGDIATGWPAVLANLKSLLETGRVLPRSPFEMRAGSPASELAGRTGS